MLSLDVEAGEAKGFRTAAGRVDAFGDVVTIETFDLRFVRGVSGGSTLFGSG